MMTREQQVGCFGCTLEEVDSIVKGALSSPSMLVMGMMSDAQEEIARGMSEEARQTLNRAKYIVSEYLHQR